MREAIGGSLLMNLVIIFTGIVILFFVSIISYSKAYGVKNRIINILEKYEEFNDSAQNEINADLKNAGYRATTSNQCNSNRVINHLKEIGITESMTEGYKNLNGGPKGAYDYCLFKVTGKSSHSSFYYVAVTFVSFEFPIIGDVVTYPIFGETRILGKDYDY